MIKRRIVFTGLAAAGFVSGLARAHAQATRPLLAVLSPISRESAVAGLVNAPFTKALSELGWTNGHNIDIVERYAGGDERRLDALATELVAMRPKVMFTNTNAAAAALARQTREIPIVVGPAGEAVLLQLAGGSLARPRQNVTGFVLTSPEIDAKCMALLIQQLPSLRRIGVLVNPRNPGTREYPAPLRPGAPDAGLLRLETTGMTDIDAALARARQERVEALFVADDAQIAANAAVRARILAFADAARIPVVSSHLAFAHAGALIAMGPSIPVLAARAAGYVDRILHGARPADLPIELPSILTTIVNRRTARALGLAIGADLLLRADEVIE